MKDVIRRCRFTPYRKGQGPSFTLVMWDTHRTENGKCILGYRLRIVNHTGKMRHNGTNHVWYGDWNSVTLFEGEDLGCSPMHAIDSNASVEACMSFLTLQPGDTDAEYFAKYTPAQLDYCQQHAAALSCEVQARFCDENGRVKP